MTISLKHAFTSPVADNSDPDEVGPDEWNAEHVLQQAQDRILGRVTAGTGATEELTAAQVRTLINVEDGATADQTGAEIKTAYEAEADTNAYTDAEKAKVGFISVTQAVDLDTMETQAATAFGWGDHASAGYLTTITGEVIGDLSDVTITALGDGEVLQSSSGTWINRTLAEAGIQGVLSEGAFVDGDKTKLDNIEASADVTDAANVSSSITAMSTAQKATLRDDLSAAPYVATRTALKDLDTSKDTVAVLTESGRAGTFHFISGDYSTEVTADTEEGVYIPADDTASTSGAWIRKYDGALNVKWFRDDIGTAVDLAVTLGGASVYVPQGSYTITSGVAISHNSANAVKLIGDGYFETVLNASGNYGSVVAIGASSVGFLIQDIGIVCTGTTTEAINIAAGGQQYFLDRCRFKGDGNSGAANLVNSNGQNPTIKDCVFTADHANVVCLEIDGYNQNGKVVGNRFGGVGKGINITNSHGASNDAEGVGIFGNKFINTGDYNIQVGDSFLTQIHDNICDQAATTSINIITDADRVSIQDNWIALASGNTTGTCVNIEAAAGNKHKIVGNIMSEGAKALVVKATASDFIDGVEILGNTFNNHGTVTVQLDSVVACKVHDNDDAGTPSNGSWNTLNTYGAGEYWFGGNTWHTTAPANFSTSSTYHYDGYDDGIVGWEKGTVTASSATTVDFNHNLFRTPVTCLATPHLNVGVWNVQGFTSSKITLAWATSGSPTWTVVVQI